MAKRKATTVPTVSDEAVIKQLRQNIKELEDLCVNRDRKYDTLKDQNKRLTVENERLTGIMYAVSTLLVVSTGTHGPSSSACFPWGH